MIGSNKTRNEIGAEVGLAGVELTAFIRREIGGGRLVRRLIYAEPARSARRTVVFNAVATQCNLLADENE